MEGEMRFRFNKESERYRTINRLFILAVTSIWIIFLLFLGMEYAEKIITLTNAAVNGVIIIAFCIVNGVIFLRNNASRMLKLVITIAMGLEVLLLGVQSDAAFLNLALIGVLAVQIPYYDKKVYKACALAYTAIYTAVEAFRVIQGTTELGVGEFGTIFVTYGIFYVLTRIGTISKLFSDHALGSVAEQSEQQKDMLEDILAISKTVKEESDKSTDLVDGLLDATETVTSSMQEISSATNLTAQNIQEQNHMTQSIQEAIEETGESSKKMVGIATESNEGIQENIKVMEGLKERSAQIANTNDEVTESMERLQNKTKEVEEIAGMILNISSQTNLLSLNASIESARAGEAGKGFAVVADQIRQLADQTRSSTEEITRIIDELNENANEVVNSVEVSVDATRNQNEMIHSAADTFEQLNLNMVELVENINEIDNRIMNLSESNNKIVENISQLSATTEEVTANAEHARSVSEQNLDYAHQAKDAIKTIQQTAASMEQYI